MMTSEGVKTVFSGDFERSSWYNVFSNFGSAPVFQRIHFVEFTKQHDRHQNMFSFTSSQAHKQRRRVFATAYNKSAITHQRVQNLLKARTAKLLRFINHQSSIDGFSVGKTGPLVVRNLFRALQADIFTAFIFSEEEGTTFLDNLKAGPNTIEDLGMGMLDLCHDEKRDRYFFWESESPFKYFVHAIDRNAPTAHLKAEWWLAGLAQRFEENERLGKRDACPQASTRGSDQGVYSKLLHWKDDNGCPLSFKQRASEVLDHTGQFLTS